MILKGTRRVREGQSTGELGLPLLWRVLGRLPWLGLCREHGRQASEKPQGKKLRGD